MKHYKHAPPLLSSIDIISYVALERPIHFQFIWTNDKENNQCFIVTYEKKSFCIILFLK